MKKIILFLSIVAVTIASCKKEDSPSAIRMTAERDGVFWSARLGVNEVKNKQYGLNFTGITYHENSQKVSEYLNIGYIHPTMEKQTFHVGHDPMLPGNSIVTHINIEYLDYDVYLAYYDVLESDIENNYIQIVHQEENYTKNLQIVFSATLVKQYGTSQYPDTIRIRNGQIDLTGVTLK